MAEPRRTLTNEDDVNRKIPLAALAAATGDDAIPGAIGSSDIQAGAVGTAALAAGALSADTAGRAKMAAGYFNEATVDDKFGAGAIDGQDRLKAGSVITDRLAPGAATGAKIAPTGFKSGSFTGAAAPGACTLTGAAVGDRVLGIARFDAAAGAVGQQASFESVITVNDQIQQTDAGNLSTQTFMVILIPAAA